MEEKQFDEHNDKNSLPPPSSPPPPAPATGKQVNPSMLGQALKHVYVVLAPNLFVYLAMHDTMAFTFLTTASIMLFIILLFFAYRDLKLREEEPPKGMVGAVALISFTWALALTISYIVAIRLSFPFGNITHLVSVIILAVGYRRVGCFLLEQTEVVNTETST